MTLHHEVIGSKHFEVLAPKNEGNVALKHWDLITPKCCILSQKNTILNTPLQKPQNLHISLLRLLLTCCVRSTAAYRLKQFNWIFADMKKQSRVVVMYQTHLI
jgi:hypothetical protein